MRVFYLLVVLLFAVAVTIFCVQNMHEVSIEYFGYKATLPLPLLIIAVYALGALTGAGLLGALRRSIRGVTGKKPAH